MASNITVIRICEYCKEKFEAKTTKTRYCSHTCNRKAYKEKLRDEKIKKANKATNFNILDIEKVTKKDFLTVKEAALLLNMSLRTVYRLIENKELNAYNFARRKTLVRRQDIDAYFELNLNNVNIDKSHLKDLITTENSYTIEDIHSKYNISTSAIYNLIKRLDIQKIQVGKHSLVRKEDIDKIFAE